MVCQWGMSDLGPLTFGERDDLIFLGRDLAVNKNFSERTSERIDDEVKKIVMRNYDRTQELSRTTRTSWSRSPRLLLEKEVLSSDEINADRRRQESGPRRRCRGDRRGTGGRRAQRSPRES